MTGHELKASRKRLKLSQQRMADIIGSKRRSWQDWEYDITPVPGVVVSLVFLLENYYSAVEALRRLNNAG